MDCKGKLHAASHGYALKHNVKELFFCGSVICSPNTHLTSACVEGTCYIEINQREVCVDREELEAEAEVCSADLNHMKDLERQKGKLGIYFYLLRFTCPQASHTRTQGVTTGQPADTL